MLQNKILQTFKHDFGYFIFIRFISKKFKCFHNIIRRPLWKFIHKVQHQFNLQVEIQKNELLVHFNQNAHWLLISSQLWILNVFFEHVHVSYNCVYPH
jgi:hypothetical protein